MRILKNWFSVITCVLLLLSCQDDASIVHDWKEDLHEKHQHGKRTCGMDHHMDVLLKNPTFAKRHQEKLDRLHKMSTKVGMRMACNEPTVLPVAVHYQGVSNPNPDCLKSLAQTQIDILNADYGGTNSDISQWNNVAPTFFPGINNGEACIKFCIASKNHPSGFGLNDGDLAVTINQTTGDQNNSWANYLNIYVRANTGLLGYAPLGGNGDGDGVVVDAAAFG